LGSRAVIDAFVTVPRERFFRALARRKPDGHARVLDDGGYRSAPPLP
jgi:hypothetical protein